jgi:DNA-directed RNA polymerase I, II, and III subunit RPABC5
MIIPVRCFTCGKVLADKYDYFLREVKKAKLNKQIDLEKVTYLTKEVMERTPEGNVLDTLKLTKYCCRRHMLTHKDIE